MYTKSEIKRPPNDLAKMLNIFDFEDMKNLINKSTLKKYRDAFIIV